MPEFRYQGKNVAGRVVQGVFTARSRMEARQRMDDLCRRQHIQLMDMQKKSVFQYKAQRGDEKPTRGEQSAFSREEVANGLRKLNYRVLRIDKKRWHFKLSPPTRDIVLFIRICADLLRERLPYDEILSLLASDTTNKALSDTIREIQQDLRDGKDGHEVFGKHVDIFGRFAAFMLGVASTSGNMAEIYESTAKFLERDEEFKKSLKSALIMPSVIMLALIGAVVYYVGYIFPTTAEMFLRFGIDLPPMTRATLMFSQFLQNNIAYLIPAVLSPVIGLALFFRTPRGRFLLDRWLIRVPVIGPLLHKTSIEIFSRVFYALYSGSGENIAVIRLAAEACRNRYMEYQIKEVALPMMLKQGKGLVESLAQTSVFTPTAISRFRSGQESGSLRTTALQLADYYERETTYKMKTVVELVNIMVSLLIAVVMTGLTLVSSETAVVKPKSPLMR